MIDFRPKVAIFTAAVGAAAATVIACADPIQRVELRAGRSTEAKRVMVLQSGDSPLYDEALRIFLEQIDFEVGLYRCVGYHQPAQFKQILRQFPADLVLAMGPRATRLALVGLENTPLLVTMVPHVDRFLEGAPVPAMGIRLETSPVSDFMQFKMLFPDINQVRAFFSEESKELIESAVKDLQPWGVELLPIEVKNRRDIQKAIATGAEGIDAIWVQSDSLVVNTQVFGHLLKVMREKKLPLITSISKEMTRAGALATVSVDWASIGSQAATLVLDVLGRGRSVEEVGIRPPVGGKISVNADTAEEIGLLLSEDVMGYVDEIIVAGGQPSAPR